MDLDRKSTTEHLVAYITTHHESLVALLPPDTTCADLFGEVENQRPIASFFSASQDAAIGRQLLRFTQMIGLWLVDEKKKTKALQQRDKRDAQETARKSILKLGPPIVPIMAFVDAQLVVEHAQNKRDESMREALLQKGYTASLRVANPHIAPEHRYQDTGRGMLPYALIWPFASVTYHLWKVAVRGTGVCSFGRPPDRPQCMGVCLKSFSVTQSYPDTHLFGIRAARTSRRRV